MHYDNVFITGNETALCPLSNSHAEGDYPNWFNDEIVCRGNSHHCFPYIKKKALDYIDEVSKCNHILVLAIETIKERKHIGNISLQKIDYISRSAELAVIIGDKKSWGKGYGFEACNLICNHAFYTLNLHRIYLGTPSYNIGMRKIAVLLGMQEEGIRRQAFFKNNAYHDIVEYGVIKHEFAGSGL